MNDQRAAVNRVNAFLEAYDALKIQHGDILFGVPKSDAQLLVSDLRALAAADAVTYPERTRYLCTNGHHVVADENDLDTCSAVLPWPVTPESKPCGAQMTHYSAEDAVTYEQVGWHRLDPKLHQGVAWQHAQPADTRTWEPVFRQVPRAETELAPTDVVHAYYDETTMILPCCDVLIYKAQGRMALIEEATVTCPGARRSRRE